MNSVVERLRRVANERVYLHMDQNAEDRVEWEAADLIASQAAEIERLTKERDALQAFKDYTHRRLDEAGVPTHPGGEHSKAGCRIGDRMDLIADRAETAERLLADKTNENQRNADGFAFHAARAETEREGRLRAEVALKAETAKLAEATGALEFYAEPTSYKGELIPGQQSDEGGSRYTLTHHVNLVRKDAGERARTTLSNIRGGDGET